MCADAPNWGVSPQVCLLVTSVPPFSRGAVSLLWGIAIQGTELQRPGLFPGATFRKAGPGGPAFRFVMAACRLARRKVRSEEHTSELQSPVHLVCRLLLEKKKKIVTTL